MLPALSLHLGEPGSSAEATAGPAHHALVSLTSGGLPSGMLTPAELLTSSHAAEPVAARAAQLPGVYTVAAPSTPDYFSEATSIVDVLPTAESSQPSGQALVADVEHALVGSQGVLGIGGDGA